MNISTSECSSGCESGWTTYWDQLSNCHGSYNRGFDEKGSAHALNEEDEDLSMVSDASSAPPNLRENYLSSVSEDRKKSKQKKSKVKESNKQQHCCLDDTASSPIFHFYQDNVAPPENNYNSVDHHVPADLSQRDPTPRRKLGFFKSSTKGKSGSLLGRKRQ